MAKKDAKPLERNLGKWPAGVDEISDLKGLQAREVPALRAAENVDVRNDGRIRRRTGRTLVREGICHSGWAPIDEDIALFVSGGVLYRMTTLPGGAEQLEAVGNVAGDSPMSYAEQAGRIYGSNGRTRFVLDRTGPMQPWGLEAPTGQPTLVADPAGGLFPGVYQVAVTFLTTTGEESGTRAAATVQVASGGGIRVTAIPQPASPLVALIRLYVTQADSETLRNGREVLPGTLETTIGAADVRQGGKELQTQHHQRVPFCKHVTAHKGRIYFVQARGDDTRLYYTAPLQYGLYKPHEHYLPLPEAITGVVALQDGIYVGTTSAVYWFGGNEPKDMNRQLIQRFGMVPGTAKPVRGTVFGGELAQGEVAVWWSTRGELIRGAGALNLNAITRGRIALPAYTAGAIVARDWNGVSQIVSSLQGPKHDSGFGTQDRAEARVFRNGVAIN